MTSKGRIELHRINLMGYTPETQAFIVRSSLSRGIVGGYNNSIAFLKSVAKHLEDTTMGYAIRAPRIPKFAEYAASQGIEVIVI